MNDGNISDNVAYNGGGVFMTSDGTFTMKNGTISSNTAQNSGGGVCFNGDATFAKIGGIITGYANDTDNGNRTISSQGGHAVYANSMRRKETTVGQKVNLSSDNSSGWDK
jgi:hypothetical protein